MEKIHIYQIYFPTSNKSYIGQSKNLKQRMAEHLNSNYPVGNALRKYDDWQIEILHTCKSRDEANRIEIEEIRNFNSIRPNGYNITRGGEGIGNYWVGRHHLKETIEKMKKNHKGFEGHHHTKESLIQGVETRRKRGTDKHTEERKQNQSKKMKGNKYGLGKRSKAFCEKQKGRNNPMFGKKRFDVAERNRNPSIIEQYKRLKNKIANLKSE